MRRVPLSKHFATQRIRSLAEEPSVQGSTIRSAGSNTTSLVAMNRK